MTDGERTRPRILLGEITGVHGIKGEVVIRSYAANPLDVGAYGPLSDHSGGIHYEITASRPGPKGVVARVAGVQDRTAAEKLRGTKLYVARSALPEAEDDAYYITDLIGLPALAPDGSPIGKITAVHNFGAGDIVEVAIGGQSGTELVPFTGAYFPLVDVGNGFVHLVMPMASDAEDDSDAGPAANENGG